MANYLVRLQRFEGVFCGRNLVNSNHESGLYRFVCSRIFYSYWN